MRRLKLSLNSLNNKSLPLVFALFLIIMPHQLKAQTLLETWVSIQYSNMIDTSDLIEFPAGVVKAPIHPQIDLSGPWKLVDPQNCIIQQDGLPPYSTPAATFYLNNIFDDIKIVYFRKIPHILLYGEEPVVCYGENRSGQFGEEGCNTQLYLVAGNIYAANRFERAIRYIFNNFCQYRPFSKRSF